MEIGVCGGPREWQMLARYRYDYCEGVLAWLASLDEDGFADAKRARAESGLDVACFNGLIPGGFDLYGTEPGDLRAYLSRAFSRAAELGGRIAVLGSGHARRVPAGMEKAEALARFADITYRCGEVAQSFGMKIAIEPLCYREDTLLNTVADGVALCRICPAGCSMSIWHVRTATAVRRQKRMFPLCVPGRRLCGRCIIPDASVWSACSARILRPPSGLPIRQPTYSASCKAIPSMVARMYRQGVSRAGAVLQSAHS